MLRTQVDDHAVVVGGEGVLAGVLAEITEGRHLGFAHAQHGADFSHQLGGADLAAPAQFLVGLGREPDELLQSIPWVVTLIGDRLP